MDHIPENDKPPTSGSWEFVGWGKSERINDLGSSSDLNFAATSPPKKLGV